MNQLQSMLESARRYEGSIRTHKGRELSLEYLVTGREDGPPLVFIHSLIASLRQYYPNIAHFSRDYRVVCLSLRGHGKSGRPRPESLAGYALSRFGDDVMDVCDHLGLDAFHYVGNSMGGLVGYDLLSRFPERLRSMTTFGTPPRFFIPKPLAFAATRVINGITHAVGVKRYSRFMASQACKTPHGREYLNRELVELVNWDVSKYAMVNVSVSNYLPVLKSAPIPFLIIRPDLDLGFNTLLTAGVRMAASNPNIAVKELDGAGHLANLDQPEAFNAILWDFLSELKG